MIAKGDSAASGRYYREEDITCLRQVRIQEGPNVTIPNSTTIKTTQQGNLPLPSTLSSTATSVVILPSLKSASLISLG